MRISQILLAFSFLLAFNPGLIQAAPSPGVVQTPAPSVSFDLLNPSLKSIPLRIPSVMNPNLSPKSRSGVTLEIGQKIFFYHKKRKHLLLVVTADLEGQKLDVAQLIKERKKELGLG